MTFNQVSKKSATEKNTTLTQTWSHLVVLRKRLLDGQPKAFTKKQLPLQQFRNFIVTLIKKSEMAIFTALNQGNA